jgi:succinyl-CoA synthetase beta subunit
VAAEELGFPVVIKAQVQIGDRGKAGGIKLAGDGREAEEHEEADGGSKGTAAAKAEALETRGVRVGRNPTQVAEIAVEILGARV